MNIARSKRLFLLILPFLCLTIFLHTSPTFADEFEIPYKAYSLNNIYFYKGCDKTNRTVNINTTVSASGSNADEKIWSALKSLGLSDEITAGILGNIHNEGSASPVRYEDKYKEHWADGSFDWENDPAKGHGVGLVQWSGDRRVNLFKHLRDKGASGLVDKYLKHPEKYGSMSGDQFIAAVDNPEDANNLYALEVDYIVYEIKSDDAYSGILNTTTVADAAEHFSMHYEQCDECVVKGSAENQERIAAAEQMYTLFTGKTSFSGGGSSGSSSSGLSPCDCDDGGNLGGGIYAGGRYSFTDEELKRFWWAAENEQGAAGEPGIKSELTFFVNRFEHWGGQPGDNQGVIDSVHNRGPGGLEYASTTVTAYDGGRGFAEPTSDQIAMAKDILNNGNRTMPPQVVEHDEVGDITSITNNGSSADKTDKTQYKTGTTVIHTRYQYGDDPPYIFFAWCDGEQSSSGTATGDCDPFGYFESKPPSASTTITTETGSITWTNDGWIEGGISNYTKEPATKLKKLAATANKDFTTDMPNAKGKGPNKITITATEGPNGAGTSGLELFKASKNKTSYPPHFTIDLVNKKLYQHFSIFKTGGAEKSDNDSTGIQIAIIGYSDSDKAKKSNNDKWDISSLTDSDYDYLTELIRGISSATGIESSGTSAPEAVKTKLDQALSTTGTSECSGGGNNNDIADTALLLSWDCGDHSGCQSASNPKPEYEKAMKEVGTYDNPSGNGYGASCDRFVGTVMRYSGADPEFPIGYANDSGGYMEDHPESYEEINFDGSNFEVLKPGDVFSTFSPRGSGGGHIWVYVEINGQQGRADASYGSPGRTAEHYTRTPVINDSRQYKVFRKK